jgi:hypothetical protein
MRRLISFAAVAALSLGLFNLSAPAARADDWHHGYHGYHGGFYRGYYPAYRGYYAPGFRYYGYTWGGFPNYSSYNPGVANFYSPYYYGYTVPYTSTYFSPTLNLGGYYYGY